jgi:hypothetical protein
MKTEKTAEVRLTSEKERLLIAGRILAEYQKHSSNGMNNWHEIAALKLHRQWDEYYTNLMGDAINVVIAENKKLSQEKDRRIEELEFDRLILKNKNELNYNDAVNFQKANDSLREQVKTLKDELSLKKCTRIEVINHNPDETRYPLGRALVSWRDTNKVYFNVQDEGRTLKVFIEKR